MNEANGAEMSHASQHSGGHHMVASVRIVGALLLVAGLVFIVSGGWDNPRNYVALGWGILGIAGGLYTVIRPRGIANRRLTANKRRGFQTAW
jgi:hypothetical protein